MISMARALHASRAVQGGHARPISVPSAHAIREWLIDQLIPAAYGGIGSDAFVLRPRRWLSFLAQYLNRRGTTVLTWWQLYQAVRRALVGLIYGMIGVACTFLATVIVYGWRNPSWE